MKLQYVLYYSFWLCSFHFYTHVFDVEKNPQEYANTYSFTVYLFDQNAITSFNFYTCSCILMVTYFVIVLTFH
jgi:hypothetical protein